MSVLEGWLGFEYETSLQVAMVDATRCVRQ